MADTGKLASFSFAATLYDADDCLQSWALNDAINEVVYQCNSMDKGAAGTRSVTFAVSLALAADDITKVSALAPGTIGVFEAHPGGDTTGYIEIESTAALITQRNLSAPINGIIAADIQIRLNDVTIQAAT